MKCKKCGNDEIESFDYGIEGVGMENGRQFIVCLSCNDRVYNPTKEMFKELKDGGEYRK